MELTIIVPVYNVEEYIRPCIDSIFQQDLDENRFEVILVNDGTKDRSMEIIQDILEQHKNITIINQENQGLSVARNVGIENSKGKYILMPDSDDLLIRNSLKPLLEIALESQADLIVADFLRMTDDEIEHAKTSLLQQEPFCFKEKSGEELFLQDLNPNQCYVWRTLFRREFLLENNLRFAPGICIQDVPFTHESYLKAKKCIRTPWLLNIYRKGHESATSNFTIKKTKDFCTALAKTWELRHLDGLSPKVQYKLREDIYTSFSAIRWIIIHKIKKASERIEIIGFLKQQVPDLWFCNGTKQKIDSILFRYMPRLFIHFHCCYANIFQNSILPHANFRLRRPCSRI